MKYLQALKNANSYRIPSESKCIMESWTYQLSHPQTKLAHHIKNSIWNVDINNIRMRLMDHLLNENNGLK